MSFTHVVLLSGGMDSTTALTAVVLETKDPEKVLTVSYAYGSKHQDAELSSAMEIANFFGCEHRIVDLDPSVFTGGNSALLGEAEMPHEEYKDVETEGPSITVVPFRNAILLANAVAIADARNARTVVFGAHATDHSRWAYPDCSPEFVGAMSCAAYIGTMHKVRLAAPFNTLTKASIVSIAASMRAPLHLTWSCYEGLSMACGKCPTCVERLKAFDAAGYIDPIEYRVPPYQTATRKFPYASNFENLPF